MGMRGGVTLCGGGWHLEAAIALVPAEALVPASVALSSAIRMLQARHTPQCLLLPLLMQSMCVA
jgi:hypothetical protein